MASQVARSQNRYVGAPNPSGLADVLELILDKGLVIDLYVRVSLVGIELLTIDARIVVASVDTYLRFAEAVGRMDLAETGDAQGLPDLLDSATSGASKSKTSGALEAAKEQLSDLFEDDEDEEESKKDRQPARRRRRKQEDDEE
jgi:hypothetical protein